MKAIIDNPGTLATLNRVEGANSQLEQPDRGPGLHQATAVDGSILGVWNGRLDLHRLLRDPRAVQSSNCYRTTVCADRVSSPVNIALVLC